MTVLLEFLTALLTKIKLFGSNIYLVTYYAQGPCTLCACKMQRTTFAIPTWYCFVGMRVPVVNFIASNLQSYLGNQSVRYDNMIVLDSKYLSISLVITLQDYLARSTLRNGF